MKWCETEYYNCRRGTVTKIDVVGRYRFISVTYAFHCSPLKKQLFVIVNSFAHKIYVLHIFYDWISVSHIS